MAWDYCPNLAQKSIIVIGSEFSSNNLGKEIWGPMVGSFQLTHLSLNYLGITNKQISTSFVAMFSDGW